MRQCRVVRRYVAARLFEQKKTVPCILHHRLVVPTGSRSACRETVVRVERETGLEPATACLGSRNSTTELLPHDSGNTIAYLSRVYKSLGAFAFGSLGSVFFAKDTLLEGFLLSLLPLRVQLFLHGIHVVSDGSQAYDADQSCQKERGRRSEDQCRWQREFIGEGANDGWCCGITQQVGKE